MTHGAMRGRRVLVIGTFDPTMPRARQWLRLLDHLGCVVEVRNIRLVGRGSRLRQTGTSPSTMCRGCSPGCGDCRRHLLTCERPDLVVFLYPGHLDACVLGPIARLRRIPACSTSSSRCTTRSSPTGGSVGAVARPSRATRSGRHRPRLLERAARRGRHARARRVLRASITHRAREHFAVLWVGADESIFVAEPVDPGDDADILWYLTYIPLHGFETVARRPRCCPDDGRRTPADRRRSGARRRRSWRRARTRQRRFRGPVPEAELAARDRPRAWICLGVFGTSRRRSASSRTRSSSAPPPDGR